jgi:hypothetical protein
MRDKRRETSEMRDERDERDERRARRETRDERDDYRRTWSREQAQNSAVRSSPSRASTPSASRNQKRTPSREPREAAENRERAGRRVLGEADMRVFVA